MTPTDLCYLSATEALRLFRARKLSPVELTEALIARAEKLNPKLKAFTYTYYDEALDLARKAEAKYARKDARLRPLEGLPIGIKDESEIAGKPTSSGSLILKDYVATETSVNNDRILKAGGIVIGRTATPEFSCAPYTHSKMWGISRNPWNPKFTPGGSSGGSGGALAAGFAPLCTGSDIGGSIRIPASTCGVVGYKPPYGRNSDDAPFNLDSYCHTGPMARSVADAILLQNIMCGPSPRDISTLRPKLRLPVSYRPIKGWKIAFSMDLDIYEVDREVVAHTRQALDVFRSLGATVEEVKLGWTQRHIDAGMTHLEHLFGAYLSGFLKKHRRVMTPYAIAFAEKGRRSKSVDFVNSMFAEAEMYATFGALMERYDVFLCPTTVLPAVSAGFDYSRDKLRINGKPVDPILGWCLTLPFNSLSRCPVLSVPTGRARNNVPTGLQIVGRTYCDADVFRAAQAYETAIGGWYGSPEERPQL